MLFPVWVFVSLLAPTVPCSSNDELPYLRGEAWYRVTTQEPGRPGRRRYFSESFEARQGKLYLRRQELKAEGGSVAETLLGAIAQDDATLSPLFFSRRHHVLDAEKSIDAVVRSGRTFAFRLWAPDGRSETVMRNLPEGTIFEGFLPVWLRRHSGDAPAGKPIAVRLIREDSIDSRFEPITGVAVREKLDAYARRSGTTRFSFSLRGKETFFWISPDGAATRMETPSLNEVTEKVARAEAEMALLRR